VPFFHVSEMSDAKRMLISLFATDLTSCPFKLARRPSSPRPAHVAEVDDIIHIMEQLDNENDLQKVRFVASNFARIPKYGPDEVNVCALADRQLHIIKQKVDEFVNETSALSCSDLLSDVNKRHNEHLTAMGDRLEQQLKLFTAEYTKAADLISSTSSTSIRSNVVSPIGRSRNIIISSVTNC